jgi:hypothetical protein
MHYREGLERVIAASAHIFQQRNLKDFANGLLQQVVALLRLEQSMLRLRAPPSAAKRLRNPGPDRRHRRPAAEPNC